MSKVVIIGGGIAGLTAGIYARKSGYEVEIFEKNQVAGGQCMGWNRKEHHIDNCIHWLTGAKQNSQLRKLWEEIGALSPDSEFVRNDKFYTSYVGEESATLWKDLNRTEEELMKLSPEDETEIKTLIEYVRLASCCQMPVEKPMDMMNILDYIKLGKSMADIPKVLKIYGKIDLKDMADRFRHPVLKLLFSDYMPKEYLASSFIFSYAAVVSGNGEVPVGGSLAMTNRIIDKFNNLGGTLHCNCEVKRVNINGNKATGIELENDVIINADFVICAVDTYEMFTKLVGKKYMNKKWMNCYNDEERYPLFSGFQTAFSIDKSLFSHTDLVFFDCEPFEINGKKIDRISVKSYQYEKSFAPKEKTVLQSNLVQFDDDYRYWKALSKEEYTLKKYELAEIMKGRIVTKFPELTGHINLLDCWTPLTYERYCNSYHGAYMSFITKKNVKSFRVKGTIDGLSNVFIASQWLQAPGGLPTAAAAGKFAVQRLLKKEKNHYMI
jgi:phytoene dehydrogenase-like protein